jgi:phage protein D
MLQSLNTNPSLRLLCPIVKAKIGKDEFVSGDGLMISASVSLGQDDRSSRGEFTIYDPRQFYADKYMKASYEQGGLVGLPPPPGAANGGGGATAGLSGFGGGDAAATERAIVAECLRQGVTDRAQIAYILATAKHESGNFIYLEEIASGEAYEGAEDLGNTQPGDGVRFKGRGYVQITGRRNYQVYSDLLGQDFVSNPAGMADPNVALFTLVDGMKNGRFTQVALGEYVGGGQSDFYNARRVVNGTDQADLIAGYAQEYLGQLDSLMAGQETPAPAAPAEPSKEQPPVEVANKGAQITIWMGYELDQMSEFTFIHTGTYFKGMAPCTTTFEGQSVRWTMTRRTKNTTYQNLTLKQLAEKVAASYGLTLEMSEDGPTYEHLDQTGITDYQLLRRECDRVGYRIYDVGDRLLIEARTGKPLGFALEYGVNLDSFEVHDVALSDCGVVGGGSGGSTASRPQQSSSTGEQKSKIDPLSGALTETRPENEAATGTVKPAPTAATGASTAAIAPATSTTPQDSQRREATLRVKGFPGSASFTTTPAALGVTPETPFVTAGLQGDWLNRVWAIDTVDHSYSSGNLRTSIRFYAPMKAPPGTQAGSQPGSAGGIIASGCNGRIAQAALAARGTDTSAGPDGGQNACAYAVNNFVLQPALGTTIGSNTVYVPSVEEGLIAQGAQQVPPGQEQAGDIVIASGQAHIGVYLDNGRVLSNSSSRAVFAWESDRDFDGYYGGQSTVYRVKC